MRRSMNLIKKLLTHVECHATENGTPIHVPSIEGHSEIDVNYHVRLCVEAGFLKATPLTQSPQGIGLWHSGIFGLTWTGHDKLDELRGGQTTT